MRRLRYNVAVSLDGFIDGPKGEYDWIVMDSTFDFEALFREFDTLIMGRKTCGYDRACTDAGPPRRRNPRLACRGSLPPAPAPKP